MSFGSNDRSMDYVAPPQSNYPPYGPHTMQPVQYPPPQHNVTNSTTVVMTQPGAVPNAAPRMWSSGICNCLDDCSSTLAVLFCPLCFACHLAGKMGESCCLPLCVPGYLTALRTKMRTQNNIEGSICNDCIMSYCCELCVMCQLSRELDYVRGHQ